MTQVQCTIGAIANQMAIAKPCIYLGAGYGMGISAHQAIPITLTIITGHV